jgi:hypothetical protein
MTENYPNIRPPADSPFYAPMRPEPTWEQLHAPCSRVTVRNTSDVQTHIVVDKYNVGHELRPGQKVEMELLNEDIARFQELRLPDRYFPASDPAKPAQLKPPHPIKIEGVGSLIEEQRKAREVLQAELARQRAGGGQPQPQPQPQKRA